MRNTFRKVSYERQVKIDLVNRHFSLVIAKVRFEYCIVAGVLRKNEPHRKPLNVANVGRKYSFPIFANLFYSFWLFLGGYCPENNLVICRLLVNYAG